VGEKNQTFFSKANQNWPTSRYQQYIAGDLKIRKIDWSSKKIHFITIIFSTR
jgi:hypothetical protein